MCAYHIPGILALGANDLVIGTPFDKVRLLTAALHPCSLSFNVHVMILVGSSRLFYCATASVDG